MREGHPPPGKCSICWISSALRPWTLIELSGRSRPTFDCWYVFFGLFSGGPGPCMFDRSIARARHTLRSCYTSLGVHLGRLSHTVFLSFVIHAEGTEQGARGQGPRRGAKAARRAGPSRSGRGQTQTSQTKAPGGAHGDGFYPSHRHRRHRCRTALPASGQPIPAFVVRTDGSGQPRTGRVVVGGGPRRWDCETEVF